MERQRYTAQPRQGKSASQARRVGSLGSEAKSASQGTQSATPIAC